MSVIDVIAPVNVRKKSGQTKSTLKLNSCAKHDETMQKSRAQWRKTKHVVHYNIFSIHAFHMEVGKAR